LPRNPQHQGIRDADRKLAFSVRQCGPSAL
jgi:hypothetical protein